MGNETLPAISVIFRTVPYVEMERGVVELPWQEVEKANLVYEF